MERRILRRLLRILRREIARLRQELLAEIQRVRAELLAEIQRLRTELLELGNLQFILLQRELQAFLNQNVEVTTRHGTIQGTVVNVGRDYLEIREADGSTVLIHFENFVSISRI